MRLKEVCSRMGLSRKTIRLYEEKERQRWINEMRRQDIEKQNRRKPVEENSDEVE